MEIQTQSSVSPCHIKNLSSQGEKLFNLFINILSSILSLPPWIKTVHEILYIYRINKGQYFMCLANYVMVCGLVRRNYTCLGSHGFACAEMFGNKNVVYISIYKANTFHHQRGCTSIFKT